MGRVRRQIGACRADGGLNIARRPVDIPAEFKLQGDAAGAERARTRHLGHARDARELAFERSRDGSRHGFRAGARQAGGDVDRGKFDLRERGDGKELERHMPTSVTPMVSRVVATGRWMNTADIFIWHRRQ